MVKQHAFYRNHISILNFDLPSLGKEWCLFYPSPNFWYLANYVKHGRDTVTFSSDVLFKKERARVLGISTAQKLFTKLIFALTLNLP